MRGHDTSSWRCATETSGKPETDLYGMRADGLHRRRERLERREVSP